MVREASKDGVPFQLLISLCNAVVALFMGFSNDSVLIGPSFASAYRNLSKRCLSAWHTRAYFPPETFATSSSSLCERARRKHFQNDKVSPES